MGIKNWMRKWLDVPTLPQDVDKSDLRRMIGCAVRDAMSARADYEGYWGISYNIIDNTFTECVRERCAPVAESVAQRTIRERIDSEDFIDQVIERIKRKQLS